MDAPHEKYESMDGKLPLTVAKAMKEMAARRTPYPACVFLLLFAVPCSLNHYHVPFLCSPSSFFMRCIELTDAGAADVAAAGSAISIGVLWCAAPQADAAALALLLPCRCRRVRRALAYLALALAIVGHSMYARAGILLDAADPGDLFFRIMYTLGTAGFAVVDLLCFLTLLLSWDARTEETLAADWSGSTCMDQLVSTVVVRSTN